MFSLLNIYISCFITFCFVTEVIPQSSCKIPNGGAGTCILLSKCPPIVKLNKKPHKNSDELKYLQQISCGITFNFKPKVCCPSEDQWEKFEPGPPVRFPTHEIPVSQTTPTKQTTKPVLPNVNEIPNAIPVPLAAPDKPDVSTDTEPISDNNLLYKSDCPLTLEPPEFGKGCCGLDASSDNKITGGVSIPPDRYPWVALLEYRFHSPNCGGSLISSRYVLTAAHCVGETKFGPVLQVRLSEYNISSYPFDLVETSGGGEENISVVIIPVERQIRHPDYLYTPENVINDIALVKLSRNAPYTDFIHPICLPNFDLADRSFANKNPYLTLSGWGSNGKTFNQVKQELKVPYVDRGLCSNYWQQELVDTQVCAGGEEGKDSCGGDSGGPLFWEVEGKMVSVVVGVVSFGHRACGTKGAPAVYTSVYKYLDWIKQETKI